MNIEAFIKQKLAEEFEGAEIEVVNESALHRGHAGDDGSGQTHFRIKVVHGVFSTVSRVEAHRLINLLLIEAFENGLHALSIFAIAK